MADEDGSGALTPEEFDDLMAFLVCFVGPGSSMEKGSVEHGEEVGVAEAEPVQ